jgi:hypothetical protein
VEVVKLEKSLTADLSGLHALLCLRVDLNTISCQKGEVDVESQGRIPLQVYIERVIFKVFMMALVLHSYVVLLL